MDVFGVFRKYRRIIIRFLLAFSFLLPVYIILYKLLMPRVMAFGCFDDCFNFMGGYFIVKGKILYSEVFYNHQMLMAYISYGIQSVFHPTNIYELVLRHRQFVLVFGFLFDFLLIMRFGLPAVGFVLLYELSKFYLFGDRFLAEGLVVYPLVYTTGLLWQKLKDKVLSQLDYILASVFTWFVVFSREPYGPLAIMFFLFLLIGKPFAKRQIALVFFVIMCIVTIISQPISDYFFNVVTINRQVFFLDIHGQSLNVARLFQAFFYPVMVFFDGTWNIFRWYLIGLSFVFLLSFGYYLFVLKKVKQAIIIVFLLGLSNLRAGPPGTVFYEAFHMIVWFGIFVFTTCILVYDLYQSKGKEFTSSLLGKLGAVGLLGIFGFMILSPKSYIHEKPDPHFDLLSNYGKEMQVGEAVKGLAAPTDTLFLDGFDDLIYWQADISSPYRYSWYTSVMPQFDRYRVAREEMFRSSPPDFYYGSCPKGSITFRIMPEFAKKDYVRLLKDGKPSCLWVRIDKVSAIHDLQWRKVEEFRYTLKAQTPAR